MLVLVLSTFVLILILITKSRGYVKERVIATIVVATIVVALIVSYLMYWK